MTTKTRKAAKTKTPIVRNYIGLKINMLTVVERFLYGISPKGRKIYKYWCRCDCGRPELKAFTPLYLKDNFEANCGCTPTPHQIEAGRKAGQERLKRLRAFLSERGVENTFQLPEIQKNKDFLNQKAAETKQKKQKSDPGYFNKIVEKRKKAFMQKYGVDNPLKNKEVALKVARSSQRARVYYHWKTGEELVAVASYEWAVVEYLNSNRIDFDWQVQFLLPSGVGYRVDLFLKEENKYIEIKGYWRETGKKKFEEFLTLYPTAEVWDAKKLNSVGIKVI